MSFLTFISLRELTAADRSIVQTIEFSIYWWENVKYLTWWKSQKFKTTKAKHNEKLTVERRQNIE